MPKLQLLHFWADLSPHSDLPQTNLEPAILVTVSDLIAVFLYQATVPLCDPRGEISQPFLVPALCVCVCARMRAPACVCMRLIKR